MRMNLKVLLPLVLSSSVAFAEDYHSISDFDYTRSDFGTLVFAGQRFTTEQDLYTLSSTWYFDSKETLGPLNEFEYINKTSNIFGAWSQFDGSGSHAHQATIGGEYFAGNFLLGGSYTGLDGPDGFTGTLGYLFSDAFLISAEALKTEGLDTHYLFNARYNHQLSGTNYIGFNFSTDDEFDVKTISSRYFTRLSGESYLAAEISYTLFPNNIEDLWTFEGDYYLNRRTSLGLGVAKDDTYSFDFTHFFTENVALKLSYATRDLDAQFIEGDFKSYSLGLTVQF